MKKYFILIAVMVLAAACSQKAPDIEKQIDELLPQITLEEKIDMIHAQSKFSSPGVPRLGIPEIWCTDGPHGVRAEVLWDKWSQARWTNDSCTAYPALTCLAASWNPEMSRLYGESIGEEALYRKKTVLLGPGVNILRHPLGGRNFEYMGEDPYLSATMVVPYVQGVQSKGVATCVKHFALNNDEIHRHTVNVNVDDRALYEIYLPAFKAALTEGGSWSVMGAYNLYKDQHLCHNERILMDILKGEWGYDGVVISDWGGVHDTDQAVRNGMDLEYGTWTDGLTMGATNAYDKYFLAKAYRDGIKSGKYGTDELDDKVRRILRLQFRTNLRKDRGTGRFVCPDHSAAARKIAGEGIVLLKNDGGILPVKDAKKILVVGENAVKMLTVGGGSSSLKVKYEISPLEAVEARFADAEVAFERGYSSGAAQAQDGISAKFDLAENRTPEQMVEDAVAAAKDADYVLVFGGLNKNKNQDSEGADRLEYGLPYGQDALVEALAEVAPKLVFVNISGNPVAMPWVDKVPAIVQGWYLGSEAGNALADVLSGDVNPSGKLPFTFPYDMMEGPVTNEEQYPGIPREGENIIDEYYSEGLLVGYRWYDTKNVKPMFAFGHGLSYTTFEYGEARIRGRKLSVSVKNNGPVAGAEVVQLYISDTEASVERPAKELKGFKKVFLQPGESKTVTFEIPDSALSFFDAEQHKWVVEPGEFVAHVGSGSDDIRTSVKFNK
ncbi:MAG: glycoside hydrolase family 3 C-terminal domain-containing protein [Bacteroidales bacterium]|nr:glycoside hydrolase family 3 C-terminal domain-containing protein [Bacteroidales bacterium]